MMLSTTTADRDLKLIRGARPKRGNEKYSLLIVNLKRVYNASPDPTVTVILRNIKDTLVQARETPILLVQCSEGFLRSLRTVRGRIGSTMTSIYLIRPNV